MSLKIVLTTYGQIGVNVLRNSIPNASGKTRDSIRFVVEEDENLLLIGRKYFELLEKGRGPTSKNPSPEMIENLTEYARARGMENPKSAAWAIAKKLNRDGDKTHRAGGRVLYSDVMDTFTQDLAKALKEDYGKTLSKEIKNAFKKK